MSSIDERVVKMEFDNAKFESGVKESLNTIENLTVSLNKMDKTNVSFDQIQRAANNVNVDNIANSIDQINDRFNTMGIVGGTVIAKLTNAAMDFVSRGLKSITAGIRDTWNTINTGGMQRAQNIENAKFQIQGLGRTWEEVSGSIDEAVNDTAYGLDEAALAASQFLATGIETGDKMTSALRSISGVAAMTNSSYSEIANIMTTIAGNGKVMTMQLNQMGAKGINAAATLRDYFNSSSENLEKFTKLYNENKKKNQQSMAPGIKATEQAVREMVTNGAIDFAIFSDAMDKAYGEHAKDAQRTFQGASSNVQAALKRLGAEFKTVTISSEDYDKTLDSNKKVDFTKKTFNQINVLNELRNVIKGLHTDMKAAGFVEWFSDIYHATQRGMAFVLHSLYETGEDGSVKLIPQLSESVENMKATLNNVFGFIIGIASSVNSAWKTIFPTSVPDAILAVTTKIRELSETLPGVDNVFAAISDIFGVTVGLADDATESVESLSTVANGSFSGLQFILEGIFSLLQLGKSIVVGIVDIFQIFVMPVLGRVIEVIVEIAATIGSFITALTGAVPSTETFREGLESLSEVLKPLWDLFYVVTQGIIDFMRAIRSPTGNPMGSLKDGVVDFVHGIGELNFSKVTEGFGKFVGGIAEQISGLPNLADLLREKIGSSLETFKEFAYGIAEVLNENFPALADYPKKVLDSLDFSLNPFESIASIIRSAVDILKVVASSFVDTITKIATSILTVAPALIQSVLSMLAVLEWGVLLPKALRGFIDSVADAITSPFKIFEALSDAITNMSKGVKFKMMAQGLRDVAIAIALLAGSIILLGITDTDVIVAGIVRLMTIVGLLVLLTKVLSKIKGIDAAAKTLKKIAVSFLVFTIAVGLGIKMITSAIAKLKELIDTAVSTDSVGSLLAAIGLIVVLTAAMIGMQKLLSMAGPIAMKSSLGFIAMAAGLLIISSAIRNLASIEWTGLLSATLSLIGILAALVGMAAILNKFSLSFKSIGPSLIAIAFGILILSSALKIVSSIGDNLLPSMGAIGALVLYLGALAIVCSKFSKGLVSGAAGLLIISAALANIATTIFLISNVLATGNLMESIGMLALLAVTLGIFAGVCSSLGAEMIPGAVGLLIIAVALSTLMGSIFLMQAALASGNIYESVILITLLSVALGVLAAVCSSIGPQMIVGAIGMTIIAGALLLLIGGVFLLSNVVSSSNLGASVGLIIALTVALGLLAAICQKSNKQMLIGAAGLIVIAAAFTILTLALSLLTIVASGGEMLAAVASILLLMVGIIALGYAAEAVAPGLAILSGALMSIATVLAVFVAGLLIGAIAFSIILDALEQFSAASIDLVGIAGGLTILGLSIMVLAAGASLLGLSMVVLGAGALVASIGLGALAVAMLMVVGVIYIAVSLFQAAGQAIMDGLLGGILNGVGAVVGAIAGVASSLIGGFCSFLGIHSPSWKFMEYGKRILEGLKIGMSGGADLGQNFGSLVGDGAMEGLSESFGDFDLSSMVGDSFDVSKLGDVLGDSGTNWMNSLGVGMSKSDEPVEVSEEKVRESAEAADAQTEIFKDVGAHAIQWFATGMREFDASSFYNSFTGENGLAAQMEQAIAEIQFDSSGFYNAGVTCMGAFLEGVDTTIENIKTRISTIIQGAAANVSVPDLTGPGSQMAVSFISGLNSHIEESRDAGFNLAQAAHDGGSGVDMWWTGHWMGVGFVNGIRSQIDSASTAGTALGMAAANAARAAGKVSSPSKVMMAVGGYYGKGFAIGISSQMSNVRRASTKMSEVLIDTMSMLPEFFDVDPDLEPTITPVMDMSNVEASMRSINSNPVLRTDQIGHYFAIADYANNAASAIAGGNKTYNINLSLLWEAGDDANAVLEELAEGIDAKLRMEG